MAGTESIPFVVVDVGNTRLKWGWCEDRRVVRAVALPDEPDAWRQQLADWRIEGPIRWWVAGVHPGRRDRLAEWLRQHGHHVTMVSHFSQIPLHLSVERPEQVGIDRVLDVLAARSSVTPGEPAIVVDAGSAVTVNLLESDGSFGGGAIFPGRRLMAEALHDYTAALPRVDASAHPPIVPAGNTVQAIAAGIHWAVVGGIRAILGQLLLTSPSDHPLTVFVTGGDAGDLLADLQDPSWRVEHRPWLTLEGLRIVADHA